LIDARKTEMAAAKKSFTSLPYELVLEIFRRLPSVSAALNLAATCRKLHALFQDPRNRTRVLRSILDVPLNRDYDLEKHFSGAISRMVSQFAQLVC
jgi:hypothetical protein